MNVKWTVEALNDLEEIELFIAKDNIDRSLSFVNELIDFGDSLGVERRNLSGTDDGFFSEIFAGMTTDYERSDTLLAG